MTDTFIYAAIRTPFGRYVGALPGVRADDLFHGCASMDAVGTAAREIRAGQGIALIVERV